jgi:hypothetical protein
MKRLKNKYGNNTVGALAVLVFAVLGAVLLLSSHAATPTASLEAENGSIATAAIINDTTASGNKGVKFQQASSGGNSCPAYPSFPDASCTGVPAGTTLTVKTGNQTINTAGTVISGWDVRGKLIINAANVTVKNSIIHGPAAGGCSNGAAIEAEGNGVTIQDVEVTMDNPTACLDGIWLDGSGATVTRANVHAGTDGFKASNDNILIQESYIHDMKWFANDPNQGGTETHNDGIQAYPPDTTGLTLRHNRIDVSKVLDSGGNLASNSTLQAATYNTRVEYNYLDGGGCTVNIAQPLGQPILQPTYINFNHFGRIRGFTGCVVLINNNTAMTEYSGNVYDDNGQAVPTWQQHN